MLSLIKAKKRLPNPRPANLYPYDFPTTGYLRIDEVRFQIEDQPEWDFSPDAMSAITANLNAASMFGFGPSFTPEQASLFDLLLKLQAGPLIMAYAWGTLSDVLKAQDGVH